MKRSSFETSGAAYPAIQRHTSEGLNIQLYGCENFKICTLFFHLPGERRTITWNVFRLCSTKGEIYAQYLLLHWFDVLVKKLTFSDEKLAEGRNS